MIALVAPSVAENTAHSGAKGARLQILSRSQTRGRVLSWRLSNTLTARFCAEALSEALARFGKPDIFQEGLRQRVLVRREIALLGRRCRQNQSILARNG